MIHSVKRKWETIYLLASFLITLLVYKGDVSNEFRFVLIAAIPIMAWDLFFNYRRFLMSTHQLDAFSKCISLNYKAYTNYDKTTVYRIFVKICCDGEEWYELDYDLCLPKVCSYASFLEFKEANNTCGTLLHTMRKNKGKTASIHNFKKKIRTYNKNRFLSLLTILIIEGVVAYILS